MSSYLAVKEISSVQLSHCPTLCDPMDCSMPGFPGHHQILEFTQTHVHWVSDTIQPSHPLSSPSLPSFNLSQHQGLFKCQFFASGGQSTGISLSLKEIVEYKDLELTVPHNTSKIHLQVEQFLQNTNWNLADLLTTNAARKIHNRVEWKRKIKRTQDETCTSGDGAMKEERLAHPGSPYAICDVHWDR